MPGVLVASFQTARYLGCWNREDSLKESSQVTVCHWGCFMFHLHISDKKHKIQAVQDHTGNVNTVSILAGHDKPFINRMKRLTPQKGSLLPGFGFSKLLSKPCKNNGVSKLILKQNCLLFFKNCSKTFVQKLFKNHGVSPCFTLKNQPNTSPRRLKFTARSRQAPRRGSRSPVSWRKTTKQRLVATCKSRSGWWFSMVF